ncbi:hypothetical protein EV363DRAFT_423731 [Boletus edulis]|nr:hypothetical protein EV363DRAFT_423731 [Boletus edulis]
MACCEAVSSSHDAACQSSIQLQSLFSFTLFYWTNGASRQTTETLAQCSLCISFTSLSALLNQLASRCVDKAIQVAQRPHILCYDNINISMSIFVEQRLSAPTKVQSGTFPILYEIEGANWEDMRLAGMLRRAYEATGLVFNADIRPTKQQL